MVYLDHDFASTIVIVETTVKGGSVQSADGVFHNVSESIMRRSLPLGNGNAISPHELMHTIGEVSCILV